MTPRTPILPTGCLPPSGSYVQTMLDLEGMATPSVAFEALARPAMRFPVGTRVQSNLPNRGGLGTVVEHRDDGRPRINWDIGCLTYELREHGEALTPAEAMETDPSTPAPSK